MIYLVFFFYISLLVVAAHLPIFNVFVVVGLVVEDAAAFLFEWHGI
jgi:hypothetical protein